MAESEKKKNHMSTNQATIFPKGKSSKNATIPKVVNLNENLEQLPLSWIENPPKRNNSNENLSENTILPPKAKKRAGAWVWKEVSIIEKQATLCQEESQKKKPCRGNLIENRSKLSG